MKFDIRGLLGTDAAKFLSPIYSDPSRAPQSICGALFFGKPLA